MLPLLLRFKNGISLIAESEDSFTLRSPDLNLELGQLSPGMQEAIAILTNEGATEDRLGDQVLEIDGAAALPRFFYYLQLLIDRGLICHSIAGEEFPLATLEPISTPYKLQWLKVELDKKYVLSRFAYLRKQDSQAILESPLFPARLILADWRSAALIAELAQPQDCHALTKIPGISLEIAQTFLTVLKSTKLLAIEEETSETLIQWEFHDLLFHNKSRVGNHDKPVGKSHRFLGKIDSLPAIKPQMSQDVIDLYKPDLEKLKDVDLPFTRVLEERRSIRNYGEPISDKQLGEFLYRVARVRAVVSRPNIECSNRPYPCGGACYEMEFYLAIDSCENISSGLYHYHPQAHQLCRLSERNNQVEALLRYAAGASGEDNIPPILIILAARFQRVAWDYESIAYSLILKHVGVLYQTMYLVATAMDLAACALGSGNSRLLATAAGTDYYVESSVGEFMLGSKKISS